MKLFLYQLIVLFSLIACVKSKEVVGNEITELYEKENKNSDPVKEAIERKEKEQLTDEGVLVELKEVGEAEEGITGAETHSTKSIKKETVLKIEKEETISIQKKETEIITSEKNKSKQKAQELIKFNHEKLNSFLQKHVSRSGIVDYEAMKKNKHQLEDYIGQLKENPLQKKWNKNKQLAYWINVYNAFTLQLILDNYPIKSITEINSGKPWDKKWIALNGKVYSLNTIENEIIRPQFKDPRIHFAVNCAAKSCPPIANFAFEEETLNTQLNKRTSFFVNGLQNVITSNKIEISKIFEWYAVDFGAIIPFLNKYSSITIEPTAIIVYKEYDWSLNEK